MTKMMIALLMASALVVGCSKEGGGDGKSGAAGDSIGVAECDEYFKKMEACMGKMPAEAKATYESSMKQNKDAWKAAAATAEGKAGLKTGCKAALDGIANIPQCK